jgi:hypothetical protein
MAMAETPVFSSGVSGSHLINGRGVKPEFVFR